MSTIEDIKLLLKDKVGDIEELPPLNNPYTETYKQPKDNTRSQKDAAAELGVDRAVIKKAKRMNAAGYNSNGTINMKKFVPWFHNHKEELGITDEPSGNLDELKIQIAQQDLQLKQLKVRQLSKELIEPQEVKNLLTEIATSQSVKLKAIMLEMPVKLVGLSEPQIKEILDMYMQQFFDILTSKI